ncbi:uncharacterized protein LOC134824005 [Bolinopsis microptera]|uniref:uncharacterized protein LOC134824005 n=1 Tax=Bolinopsis microptera TaxID=2820187 RepID=UPI00307AA7D7
MSELQASIGRVLDNTYRGEEGCLSLRRAEKELTGVFRVLVTQETALPSEYVEAYIAECVKLWDELMCDGDCAGEMQDTFYSNCCIKRAAEFLNSKQMRKHFNKLFKNVWSLYFEEPSPKRVVDQYLSMFEPATFCGDKTGAYKYFNKQCDQAIGA